MGGFSIGNRIRRGYGRRAHGSRGRREISARACVFHCRLGNDIASARRQCLLHRALVDRVGIERRLRLCRHHSHVDRVCIERRLRLRRHHIHVDRVGSRRQLRLRLGTIPTAAERVVLAPQIAAWSDTRRLGLVDPRKVLPALLTLGMIGDRPEDDREARLIGRLIRVHIDAVFVARAHHLGHTFDRLASLLEPAVVLGADVGERTGRETLRGNHLISIRVEKLKRTRVTQRDVNEEAVLDLVCVRRRAVCVRTSATLLVAEDQAVVEPVVTGEAEICVQLIAQILQDWRHLLARVVEVVHLCPLVVRAEAVVGELEKLGLGCHEARYSTQDPLHSRALINLEAHVVLAELQQLLLLLWCEVPQEVA
jgi:hypothetical protein